jgi:hypothetical protein
MLKLRSFLIAVALVALLGVTNSQTSFASAGDGQLNMQGYQLQSKAPVMSNIQCTNNFEPTPDGKCECPEGRKIGWDGKCKAADNDDKKPKENPCVPATQYGAPGAVSPCHIPL